MQIKRTILLLMMCFVVMSIGLAQKVTISGYIEDQETGERLIAANVFDSKSGQGTVTNNFGFYSLTLPIDSVQLTFSYIGYQSKPLNLDLKKDIQLNIELSSDVLLQEVEIVAERLEKIEEQTQMSKVDIPVELIKKIPTLFGEVDVLKTLQLLPGVQSGGEGQTGLYVRGGSPDQNLILLDGVPVYNVSHLLGIFSVFNADAIKTVTLTKGGFPARFGGRLSSVLEINMKDGHKEKIKGEGSIGIISSKFTLQGPIIKGKTTFLVSARRTYWDLLARPLLKRASQGQGVKVDGTLYFYDANAKIVHQFDDKNRLFLSFYSGADIFKTDIEENFGNNLYKTQLGVAWGNVVTAARWNHQFTPKLFLNTTMTYSNYDLKVNASESDTYQKDSLGNLTTQSIAAIYKSGIKDFSGKLDFDYIPSPNHYVRFGASATRHIYSPGALSVKFEDETFNLDTTLGTQPIGSMEYDAYVEDDMKFGALKMNIGLHLSAFAPKGVVYTSLQPRIGLRYLLPSGYALKGSFTTMTQYLNLLASESFSLPSDLWVPSTKDIVPQQSWQSAIGVAKSFKDYELSVEGFYKQMKNVVSYLPGESFLTGLEVLEDGGEASSWENKITQGDGEAYGAEVFLQKKKGRTTGWIGYTLSWNWRQFDKINGGKKFAFKYDRRHDISIVVTHQFTEKISASATWVYGTGNAVSLPESKLPRPGTIIDDNSNFYGSNEYENPSEKNKFRMSNYHRLDLGVDFTKKKKRWTRTWSIGVYNAYFHKNPYFITRSNERDAQGKIIKVVFKEVSILPFLPSISYSFKF